MPDRKLPSRSSSAPESSLRQGHEDPGLQWRKEQLDVRSWGQRSDRVSDMVEVLPNEAPVGGHQDHDGQTVSLQVLLVAEILVRRDQCRKALGFGGTQELAVLQRLPTVLERRDDVVTRKGVAQWDWRALIEQDLHARRLRGFKAAPRVLDYGVNLLARDAWKPLDKFLDGSAALDVLEKRLDRHTGVPEKPGAADFPGDAFNRWALAPIEHGDKMVHPRGECKPRGNPRENGTCRGLAG